MKTTATLPGDKPPQESEFYDALVRRDDSYKGRFFYGVRTTGVYCLPTCASRQPRRENVDFFSDEASAVAGGYRACKRCKPNRGDAPDPKILDACQLIESSDSPLPLKALAKAVGLSETYFQRTFKKEIGVSPKRYSEMIHQRRLRAGIKGSRSVTQAMYDAGFDSSSAAYAASTASLGMTPTQFQTGGTATHVTFAIVESALGLVLVATTNRGICRVDIDDDAGSLEQRLRAEFFDAAIERAEDRMQSTTSLIVQYLSGATVWPRLPVDVRGTAFQTRVWHALREIAAGTTLTYGELAAAIGSPSAARAVASACASNPIALLIPCHRIVPAAGGVGAYRWGAKRKRLLLEIEQQLQST